MINKIILFLLIFPNVFLAQTDSIALVKKINEQNSAIDSLTKKLVKDSSYIYRFKRIRPFLNIDNRNSSINGAPVNFKGIQFGVILNEINTLGLGFYAISQVSQKPRTASDGTITADKNINMNYMTFFYLHSFIEKKYIDLNFPLEIGFGGYKITYSDHITKNVYKTYQGGIIPLGFGFQVILKPTTWVGISILGGYRLVIGGRKESKEHFSGLYSSLGLTFDIRQIYRDIKYRGFVRKRYRREVKEILSR